MSCTFCGSKEHSTKLCPKTWDGQIRRGSLYCNYCGSVEHNTYYCPKTYEGGKHRKENPDGMFID